MIEPNEEENFTPRDKVIKWLHILMIFLCLIATIALFSNPSTGSKLIISFFLIAYTITIVANSSTIKLIFKIGQSETEKKYKNLRQWEIQEEKPSSESKAPKLSPIYNNTNFIWNNNQTESIDNLSFNKSTERSQDIKNMSMSIYRSLSASGINDSRLSRIKSSVKRQEIKGHDLSEAFIFKNGQDTESSVLRSQGSGMTLVDNQTYLSSKTQKFLESADQRYEETLKRHLKKDRRFVSSKYESILNYIKNLLKSNLNQHRFATDKIRSLTQQFFDINLQDSDKQLNKEVTYIKSTSFSKKMSFNVLIYKLLLLKAEKIQTNQTGLTLKMDKRWSNVQARLEESLKTMIRLGQSLGIDPTLLSSRFKENTKKFVEDYFQIIDMIGCYLNTDKKEEKHYETSSNTLCYASKCRTFALYLIVKQFNVNLKYAGKIKFNDNLNLRYPHMDNVQFQIVKRPGSEDPLIHFDLQLKKDENRVQKYYCQPGEKNYLSVIFFLLQELSKKSQLLSWNMDIKQLVNEMI